MKITQKIIDDLTEALAHTKKDGTENWKDGMHIQKRKEIIGEKMISKED